MFSKISLGRPQMLSTDKKSDSVSLSLEEYKRYGRQMILDGFGLPGQLKLKQAKVAVIGAGGLGCPALQYLVGAGIGFIGIFDHDTVETSNLHRQILHTSERVGWFKAESAKATLQSLNPFVHIESIAEPILPGTALGHLAAYDILLDCTDRPQTRYLISDAAVKLGIPLVSGAAIGLSGQWSVYGGHHQAEVGRTAQKSSEGSTEEASRKARPCYRCIWPKPLTRPSQREGAGTCEEEGVLGPTVGVVGVQMAAEAIKVILGLDDPEPKLNMLSLAPSMTPFRSIKMRGPSPKCIACGPDAKLPDDLEEMKYDEFCAGPSQRVSIGGDNAAASDLRVSAKALSLALSTAQNTQSPPLIIDVRQATEFSICSLPGSINIPMESFLSAPLDKTLEALQAASLSQEQTDVYFLCRRGNDSLTSALALRSELKGGNEGFNHIYDVAGGIRAWSREVDPRFPMY